ncbi:hypothetical protein Q0Z83_012280 [Actinoplanes sichuanensis]|uniref:Uncharacterized protein n=1 Tax=Actinoplanes sichuanensis TaxID=512349 RepID=A0ABW4A683_9ACTN|nr:hypothetical protein [Actinoplanes sichuanensis]BEL03037.1 hypothetical protein Q0Z83_012280 [Actinoplanes sichuanensis]
MTMISGHDYEQPTERSFVAALAAAVGPETARALVDLTAKRVRPGRPYTPDDLVRMAEALMEVGDQLRVTARSEKIRAVTYRALYAVVK